MLISCFSAGLTVSAANKAEADIPIIWIMGGNGNIFSSDGRCIYPVEEPDGYIADAVKDCLPSFFSAIMFGNVKPWKEKFLSWMTPLYDEVKLDKNGENTNGTYYSTENMDTVWINPNSSTCTLDRYGFSYDFRLDPYENAEILARYINRVKTATGSDEVSLYGRCEGATVLAAYLDLYGDEGIHKIGLNASALNGNDNASKPFSGKIELNADIADEYASYNFIVGDDMINMYFWEMWDALRDTYGLDITVALVNRIYKNVVKKVLPDFLLSSYATFTGAWSMVCEEDYNDALDFIFYNDSIKAEYSGLYEKITRYHDNARAKLPERLTAFKESGRDVGIFAKYGFTGKPVFADCDSISDGDIKLVDESFGATTAKWGETLSDEYIRQAEANGTDKYISPDKQVDASTCLFPDSTWFIKNCFHSWFTDSTNTVVTAFFHTQGMTIDTYEQFPQYTVFYEGSNILIPMTEENCHTEDALIQDAAKPSNSLFISAFFRFIKTVFNFLSLIFGGEELNFSFSLKYI